jgi:hypothetical protein
LYGWNTLGACLGVLATEFLLLRLLGHSKAFVLLVVLNILVALAFVVLARLRRPALRGREMDARDRPAPRRAQGRRGGGSDLPPLHRSTILLAAVLSGFMAGALEVDMFRAVRFSGAITDAAMSFTSFWAIAAIFLASWTVRALGAPKLWVVRGAAIGALFVYALTWSSLPELRGWFNERYMAYVAEHVGSDPSVANVTIYPLSASLTLLLGFTGAIVFPAYYLISLMLPTVCNAAQAQGQHLGRAYGWNTVAFCLGAMAFAWGAPRVDLFFAVKLLFAIMAIGALLALSLRRERPVTRPVIALGLAAVCLAVLLVPRGFDRRFFPRNEAPARYPVRALKSNGTNTTYVVEQPDGDVLYFDSYPMSGVSASARMYMSLMAHMPLLAHPAPKDALLICFGVGNTARAITSHEGIRSLDIVDLNDKVFETADEFARTNGRAHRDPRTRLIHDDGRGYLERTDNLYDLVTSEPPPPRAAGVYRLYSVEYYRSILEHLTPQGMMTQWLPVNILSRTAAHRMIASFAEVFPHVLLFVGTGDQLILLGGRQPFDASLLERRFSASAGGRADLALLGVSDPVQLLARVILTDGQLRADIKGVRPISDERNDLALAVTDPFDRFKLELEPRAVLDALGAERLLCGPVLTGVLSHRGRLLTVVPDYFGAQVTR